MDYLLRMRIDRYFDVTDQQEDFITRRLAEHLRWHRYEGVPVHLGFLNQTLEKVADGVEREEIFWFFRQYREQLRMIVQRLSSDSVVFLLQLTDEQIDYFAEQLHENNEKYRERLDMSRGERLEARADSTIDFLEEWLGELSDKQVAEIRKISLALPDRFEPWYRQRLERQQRFVTALREKKGEAEIREALLGMLLPPDRVQKDASLEPIVRMIQAIDRMATPQQRQHVMKKLQSWADGLRDVVSVKS